MTVTNKSNLNQDKISDPYGTEALNRLKEMVACLSEDTKKQLSHQLTIIASRSCPKVEEQSLAEAIVGKTYSAEETKELEILNLMNSLAERAKLLQNTISTTEVAKPAIAECAIANNLIFT